MAATGTDCVDKRHCLEHGIAVTNIKGYAINTVPEHALAITDGEHALATYTFGTHTAKHMFCRTCGIHPFYVPRSDPDKIDINARCLDNVDPAKLSPQPFDGKNWEAAMEKRVRGR